jgi:hexaprenyl-diphosphate synthase
MVNPSNKAFLDPSVMFKGADLKLNIPQLMQTGHPVLKTVSSYYFSASGKHIRPIIVLLMAKATAPMAKFTERMNINEAISITEKSFETSIDPLEDVLPSQYRLAEITEMIHTASLMHDDVIDDAVTRRSQESINYKFGNKMAILAGDYLLAQASVALARLRNVQVVELLATVIANLVEGEVMQLKNGESNSLESSLEYYLEKSYLKTASLIAKSCRASALLSQCEEPVVNAAFDYGKSLGLAFQVVN